MPDAFRKEKLGLALGINQIAVAAGFVITLIAAAASWLRPPHRREVINTETISTGMPAKPNE